VRSRRSSGLQGVAGRDDGRVEQGAMMRQRDEADRGGAEH
jgi:hypothetical protein